MTEKKPKIHFLMTTVLGGAVFLVPLIMLIYILGKAVGLTMKIARPMADFLPVDTIGGVALANILAILVVILICFLAGYIARVTFATRIVEKLESKVLIHIPGYALVRGMASSIKADEASGLRTVLVTFGVNARIGLEMERIEDGARAVVYLPSSPSIWSGIVQIVPAENVEYLDLPIMKVKEHLEQFGKGTGEMIQKQG
jgi:uncharacterized membrane protein